MISIIIAIKKKKNLQPAKKRKMKLNGKTTKQATHDDSKQQKE